MYISEFDRQQLLKQIDGIKNDLHNVPADRALSSIITTLRAMAFTLSDKDKMPICQYCGAYLSYCCKVCGK